MSNAVRRARRALYADLETPHVRYGAEVDRLAARATRILDLGCGYEAPGLARLPSSGTLKCGIDAVADLRPSRAQRIRFVRGDGSRLPFADGSFDLVISKSVLEHLTHPERVLAEVARVLAPGGHFVFLTPNFWDYVSIGAWIIPNALHGALVKALTGRREEDTFPTRYRANTVGRLQTLARKAGLDVAGLSHVREHPHYLSIHIVPYLLGAIYEKLVPANISMLRPWILGVMRRPGQRSRPTSRSRPARAARAVREVALDEPGRRLEGTGTGGR